MASIEYVLNEDHQIFWDLYELVQYNIHHTVSRLMLNETINTDGKRQYCNKVYCDSFEFEEIKWTLKKDLEFRDGRLTELRKDVELSKQDIQHINRQSVELNMILINLIHQYFEEQKVHFKNSDSVLDEQKYEFFKVVGLLV